VLIAHYQIKKKLPILSLQLAKISENKNNKEYLLKIDGELANLVTEKSLPLDITLFRDMRYHFCGNGYSFTITND
jgi:hypothetical protein